MNLDIIITIGPFFFRLEDYGDISVHGIEMMGNVTQWHFDWPNDESVQMVAHIEENAQVENFVDEERQVDGGETN